MILEDVKTMYKDNTDFKDFVARAARTQGKSEDQILTEALARYVAEYYKGQK